MTPTTRRRPTCCGRSWSSGSGSGRTFQELEAVVLKARTALDAAADQMGVVRAKRALAQVDVGDVPDRRVAPRPPRACTSASRKLGSTAYQSEIVPAIEGSAVFSGGPCAPKPVGCSTTSMEMRRKPALSLDGLDRCRSSPVRLTSQGSIPAVEATVVVGQALRRAPAPDRIADRGGHHEALPLHRLLVGGRRRGGGDLG